uniref:Retrotransposon protein, putative, unclassified n=2 Tax=Oryza sativa subsp. japonica TaxID=39947 RepID=Q53LX0_ORYSJ|nr:retrotransposon protein, putative, unclassified [Oryza sativa Japonica Group]ABA93024.1 retrotransposon protein, putative, unclassified [Oryza sativa Japonica Group]
MVHYVCVPRLIPGRGFYAQISSEITSEFPGVTLADLAFQGMIAPIREKFSSEDFDSLSHLIQKVTLHEQRSAEARKNSKRVNHVCPYMYRSDDDDDDSEIAAAEWVRSKNVIPCQWVKNSGKEERQLIQVAIEGGKIKCDDSKRPMKVDGNPFPVNMVHTAGRTADAGRMRGFQVNSAKIRKKYQSKYDKQQERRYEEDNGVFDPHWGSEFGIDQADVDEVEEESAKLVLSPEQAVFEKPEGTENRHLKPLYINGYVNGKPMSNMMVDGGAAWQGDKIEIVLADRSVNVASADLALWEMDGLDCLSGKMENPSYYFEGVVEGSNVYTKDTVDDLDDKQGQGFMSADDLEETDIGPGDRPRPTFIRVRPHQQPPRRCKADMLEPVKAEIKLLYDAGFIRPCRYTEWVSSIVPVIKKNSKVRVCIDFRDLNKATPKDEYPMPVADQLVDAASGHKILSFMDGNAGYNQIFMAEQDIHKTAFRCPGAIGLFEWVVMTFGLKSAGATYQRAINYIYHDLIGWLVEVYIDDVVVKSKEIEDHIADLRKVFERTRIYGLKMNPTKCAFGVSAGQFLGFLVHERGIEITQRSINAIKKIKPPEDKIELQEMIGKINFVRRYMLSAPILKGMVGKWIFSLTGFDLRYESPKAIKGQAIADFIVDHRDNSIGSVEIAPWTLFFDGSVCTHGCGIGLVIISPRGACFEFAYTIKPYATNNQAEYEAVLKGLQLLKEVEADAIEIMGGSLLVMSQLAGEYECKNDTLIVYNEKCQELMKEFRQKLQSVKFMKGYVQFADSMGIKLLNSSPYYAQANGQAEASNKSLIKLIKRKISDYSRQWHTRLAEALWSYRMAFHGSIQVPPYKLVYGHEAVLPWEVRIGSRRTELQNTLTTDEYYNLMADEWEDLVQSRLRALAKVTKDKERVARHYNKKVVPKDFLEGELVWKLIMPIETRDSKFGKWSPNWEGPFQIHKVVSKGTYMLQGLDGEVYGRALNGKYLKKYYHSV